MKEQNQFKICNKNYGPKMRWWLPGAFLDDEELGKEIRDMAEAGYKGAEILYFMGIPSEEVNPESYSEYYFGSKQWNDRMKHALRKAIELDFQLDFTVGPLWPIATPAISDENDYRNSWGLHVATIDLENDSFSGALPVSDTIDQEKPYQFVAAAITKKMDKDSDIYQLDSSMNITEHVNVSNMQLSFSLSQILKEQKKEGLLADGTWTIFAYYAQQTGQKNDSSGTRVIDHLSKAATQAVLTYWEDTLMGDPEIRALYEKNAGNLFCDSIEVNATMLGGMYGAKPLPVILWTPTFLETFQEKRGYDLIPYLQCIYIEGLFQITENKNLDKAAKYRFQEEFVNRQIQNDYYQTITEMINENHITLLKEWANSHNMQLRYQIYGLPTEMTSSLHHVDVPESESLGFADRIEDNLLLAGAVHMEKKPVYSYELGAQPGRAYEHMWTKENGLLWQMHQAMAAGINQVVLHGMSYNTQSVIGPVKPMFQWPGLSLMGTMFSNEWGDRQPIWEHASMMTEYITRLQWVLRQGKPRVDLAIFRQEYDGVNYAMNHDISAFSVAGYSYEFVSSFLLSEGSELVTKEEDQAVWDKDGAAYKALIVDYQRNKEKNTLQQPFLTLQDMKSFIQLAKDGLAIFWTIGEPQFSAFYQNSEEIEEMKKIYQMLLQFSTVYEIDRDSLISEMQNRGIQAARIPEQASNIIHVRRNEEGLDYYYLYNQSKTETVKEEFTLTGKGKPYLLNCWNGEEQEIEQFTTDGSRITLQMTFAPNEGSNTCLRKAEWNIHYGTLGFCNTQGN